MYLGTFDKDVYVLSEATGRVVDKIPLRTGIPRSITLNHDKTRFYVLNVDRERVEVVDIASKKTLDVFTMSEGNEKVRIWSFEVSPDETKAIFVIRRYRRLADHWDVGDLELVLYDLKAHEIARTLPWPGGEEEFFPSLFFSPDGRWLYYAGDEIKVFDAKTFEELDQWDYGRTLDEGMGVLHFRFSGSPYDPDGSYTNLFRTTDPATGRDLMGIARVDLADRRLVSFAVTGPASGLRFTLGPHGRGYGLHNEVGDYQLWTFDLESGRVTNRTSIQGRPRMRLEASSNGKYLYVWQAGNTIDLLNPKTGEYVHTIQLDADGTTGLVVIPAGRSGTSR